MKVFALIDLPDDRVGGMEPDEVAESVLARVQDEAGYRDDDGMPLVPAEVTVLVWRKQMLAQPYQVAMTDDPLVAAIARGHGPALPGPVTS